jgi:tetratricopeptide (TPR) repeat protein
MRESRSFAVSSGVRARRFAKAPALPLFALCSALAGNAAAQTDNDRAAARAAAQAGDTAYRAGRYQEAADYFERAEHIVHAPTLLLFLARSQARLGHYVRAREAYIRVTREVIDTNSPAVFRDAVEAARRELPDVDGRIPTITITVDGAQQNELHVTIDGNAVPSAAVGLPYPLDPGPHQVQVAAEGREPAARDFALREAEHGQVRLALGAARILPTGPAPAPVTAPPNAPGAPPPSQAVDSGSQREHSNAKRIGAYVGFGVGAVGVALGTVFLVQHVGKGSDADKAFANCAKRGPSCNDPAQQHNITSLDKDAASAGTLSVVMYAVGGVGIATGVTLLVLQGAEHEEKAGVRPYFTGTGGGLVGRF